MAYRGVESVAVDMRWRNFHNSGANAISVAILCGASRVVLLGYDCALTGGRSHHHGDHPAGLRNCDTLAKWPAQFAKVAAYADRHHAIVLNASRASALTCFARVPLEQVLDAWVDGTAELPLGEQLRTVGVTGTNGKTTVVSTIRHVLESAGREVAAIGTLTGA